jgi:hypothetical protein
MASVPVTLLRAADTGQAAVLAEKIQQTEALGIIS